MDDGAGIATARLSIIDLTHGQQPLGAGNGRYWIAYNGEVYNYLELRKDLEAEGVEFATQADTEVVLQAWIAWGPKALARLNGGFAFAIHDRLTRNVILVRDRYGKRPLFLAPFRGGYVFASEMKCFLACEGFDFRFEREHVENTFTFWTPLPDQTAFVGVEQVPPGDYFVLSAGSVERHHYAPLRFPREPFQGSEADAVEQTRQLLEDSVRLRLRSDVEVGTYLSGGLDSAIITQLAARQTSKTLHTFSVAFEDGAYDEEPFQLELSKYLGTSHRSIKVGNRDIADLFPEALWHAEVPVFRTAFVPLFQLSEMVRKAGIKVVMTGEGADEAFLGYDIFREVLLLEDWKTLSEAERTSRIGRLYPYLKHFRSENAKSLMGVYDRLSMQRPGHLFSHQLRFSNSSMALRLLTSSVDASTKKLDDRLQLDPGYGDLSPLEKSQWLEYKTLLAGYLLSTQGDRMSLAHSVENRCPFLDFRLIDLAFSLPVQLRMRSRTDEKWILKEAFRNDLPEFLGTKPKQPYRAPDVQAFFGSRPPDYLDAVLSSSELEKIDFLDHAFCARFVEKMRRTPHDGISPRENQAFILLLSLALLRRDFVERRRAMAMPVLPRALLVRRLDFRGQQPGAVSSV